MTSCDKYEPGLPKQRRSYIILIIYVTRLPTHPPTPHPLSLLKYYFLFFFYFLGGRGEGTPQFTFVVLIPSPFPSSPPPPPPHTHPPPPTGKKKGEITQLLQASVLSPEGKEQDGEAEEDFSTRIKTKINNNDNKPVTAHARVVECALKRRVSVRPFFSFFSFSF